MENIVEVSHLVKKYPAGNSFFTALNNINIAFNEGEFAGLVDQAVREKPPSLTLSGL